MVCGCRGCEQFLLGEDADLLGGKQIVDVAGLQPGVVEFDGLFVGDLALGAHGGDAGLGLGYSRRLREFSSGMLTAS
jgi:hypothetical protein